MQTVGPTSNNKTAVYLPVSEKILQLPVPELQTISIEIIKKKLKSNISKSNFLYY